MWSKPRTRAAVACGRPDRGDVRVEMWWEMPLEERVSVSHAHPWLWQAYVVGGWRDGRMEEGRKEAPGSRH